MVTTKKPEDDEYTAGLGLDPADEAIRPKSEKDKKAKPKAKPKEAKNQGDEEAASEAEGNAQGETQAEFGAAVPKKAGPSASQANNPVVAKLSAEGAPKMGPIDPADPAGGGTYNVANDPYGPGGPKVTPPAAAPKPQAPSAAEALMNSLVGQYQQAMGVVDPYINGSVGATDVANATALGASIGGPTQAPPAAASSIDSALTADAQAYQKANDAGAAGMQAAMKNTGLADQQYLAASPYMGLLNALQTEATYKQEQAASGGAGLALPPNAPAGLTGAVANLAGSATNTTGAIPVGTTPATNATTPSTDNQGSAGGGNAI